MVYIQVDLSEEEDKILETYAYISGKKDKRLALKDLLIEYSRLNPNIKNAIQLKKKVK